MARGPADPYGSLQTPSTPRRPLYGKPGSTPKPGSPLAPKPRGVLGSIMEGMGTTVLGSPGGLGNTSPGSMGMLSRLGQPEPRRPFTPTTPGGYHPTVRDISAQIAAGDLRRTIANSLRGLI